MLDLVVTKKVRDGERIASGLAFRSGFDMAGAEARLSFRDVFGTTEVVPCYKAKSLVTYPGS
jgi:hypothetical protein